MNSLSVTSKIGKCSYVPCSGLAKELCQFSCCLYGPRCPVPTISQTILGHTGETGTASYSAHAGPSQDQDFLQIFSIACIFSPSWLTHPLSSRVWDSSPAHMLPLCKICIQALRAFTCIEERYHKHASVSACVLCYSWLVLSRSFTFLFVAAGWCLLITCNEDYSHIWVH